MGDYNISCFVTKQTIREGDKVFFIPLKKSKYSEYGDTNFVMMNVTGLYHPATLQILGTYEACGRIIPEKTEHTTFLEKHFNMPIEKICDLDGNLFDGGCYVHFDAFHVLRNQIHAYNGKCDTMFTDRCNEDYKRWMREVKREKEHHEKMIRLCERDINDGRTLDEYTEQIYNESKTALDEFKLNILGIGNIFGFCETRDFCNFKFYSRALFEGEIDKQWFIHCFEFMNGLYSVATPLAPVLYGEQDGNQYMAQRLIDVSQRILDKHKK